MMQHSIIANQKYKRLSVEIVPALDTRCVHPKLGTVIPVGMSDPSDPPGQDDADGSVVIKEKVKRPSLYKVLLLNDDYTTMEFVVHVLQSIFGKTIEEAQAIMLKIHHEGAGICGVYTFEVAETLVNKVQKLARQHGHPLRCELEKE